MTIIHDAPVADNPVLGFLWPTGQQQQLLDIGIKGGEESRRIFREWRASIDIDEEFGWTVLGLCPLAHDALARAGETDPLMGRLKGVSRMTWYATQQLLHRVKPVLAALHEAHIPALLLKGAPMVLSYYASQALRPMTDVDVCVHEEHLPRAMAILDAAGWRATSDFTPDYLRFRHALQYSHPDGGELDLHWRVMYESMLPGTTHWGWDDTEPLSVLGVPALQLKPTSMLFNHVVHGVRWNEATPVRWIPDAVTVLRTRGNEVDWDRIVADAVLLRVTMRTRIGLEWLVSRYGVEVPADVITRLRAIKPTLLERIEARVYLADHLRLLNTAAGNQQVILADLCRVVDPADVLRFATTLPHYLRYRWDLKGRREIVPALWRAASNRLRGTPISLPAVR